MQVKDIPIDKLFISNLNVRVDHGFGDEEDQEFINNVQSLGMLQPVVVRPSGELFEVDSELNSTWYEEEVDFMSKSRYESYKENILDFMSDLDLSDNQLTGGIPSQIGYLNTLHTLNLSNKNIRGRNNV